MKLRNEYLYADHELEVPPGWTVLDVVDVPVDVVRDDLVSPRQPVAVVILTELDIPPTVEELIRGAIAAEHNALGVPGPVLRQAFRELGYDVPEPDGPGLEVADASVLRRMDGKRPIRDNPQA